MPPPVGKFMVMVVALTMAATPFLALLAHAGERRLRAARPPGTLPEPSEDIGDLEGHVVIAGMGRVGSLVGKVLEARQTPMVGVDLDTAEVARQRRAGRLVFFGDAARRDLLARLGLDRAAAVVITLNDWDAVCRVLDRLRADWPELKIYARARDAEHARLLLERGATHVVPETVEASLQLAERVLEDMGLPQETADGLIDAQRAEILAALESAPGKPAPPAS
jgi:CPA2 family monovalent cation:H+ antiporter-2